jgi:hypothetical protein
VFQRFKFCHPLTHTRSHALSFAEAAELPESSLRTEPVFDPGYKLIEYSPSPDYPTGQIVREMHSAIWVSDLTDPIKGSDTAREHSNTLLAEMFPATTLATGGQKLPRVGEIRNIDMQDHFKTGWPAEREVPDWDHSDIKEVAYPFIYRAFDAVVELGKLK